MFAWNGCATKHKNNLKHLLHSIYYYYYYQYYLPSFLIFPTSSSPHYAFFFLAEKSPPPPTPHQVCSRKSLTDELIDEEGCMVYGHLMANGRPCLS